MRRRTMSAASLLVRCADGASRLMPPLTSDAAPLETSLPVVLVCGWARGGDWRPEVPSCFDLPVPCGTPSPAEGLVFCRVVEGGDLVLAVKADGGGNSSSTMDRRRAIELSCAVPLPLSVPLLL